MSRRRRGRMGRLFFSALVLAAVAAIGLAPHIVSQPPLRDWVIASVLPGINGRVTVASANLGWLHPVHFEKVQITDAQGQQAIAVETIDGDKPLWRLALRHSSPGTFRLKNVRVDVIPGPQGSNLVRLIAPEPSRRPVTIGVEIVDGLLALHRPDADPLEVGLFQLALDINDDPSRAPRELVIRPGTLLKNASIASPKSGDLLKYALPLLAESNVSGQFSLELDGWRVPFAAPEKATGSGRLMIHAIDVEPGPMVHRLAEVFQYPATIQLARDATVPFGMADGRISHQDLTFTLRNLTLRTQGSVGLDQTLDVVADVELPQLSANRPLLQSLRKVSIPIHGTLDRPAVDAVALQQSGLGMVREALDGLLRRRTGKL